jgi:hypothetical protein
MTFDLEKFCKASANSRRELSERVQKVLKSTSYGANSCWRVTENPLFYNVFHSEVTQLSLTSTIVGDFLDRLPAKSWRCWMCCANAYWLCAATPSAAKVLLADPSSRTGSNQ